MKRLLKAGDVFHTPKISFGLVVDTKLTGGGTGMGPHDIYPDGHQVTWVQLKDWETDEELDGSMRPISIEGRRQKKFYQTGAFTDMILPKDVTFVHSLKQKVLFS